MPTLVMDPAPAEIDALLERRRRLGLDHHDEMWEGVLHMNPAPHGRHHRIGQQLAVALDAQAAALHWLEVNTAVAEQADVLARRWARSHSGIDAVDYCVAASAMVNEMELWTLNVRHFPMFEQLRPPYVDP